MPTIIRFGGGAGGGAQKLVVNVDSGATVTARKGSVAVSAVSENGQAVLELDEAGTYTVSATKDGTTTPDVKTATVPQEITLSFVAAELNTNSWEMIKAVSDAGQGANYWSVGDTKDVTLSGTWQSLNVSNVTVKAFIIGFNHNSAVEGANRIHFLMGKIGTAMVAFCDSQYGNRTSGAYFTMNTTDTNSYGWKGSRMYKTVLGNDGTPDNPLQGSLMAVLPEDLRAVMKPVTKYTLNSTIEGVSETTDYAFLLAEYEIFGTRTYADTREQSKQAQYDYFKAGNPKVFHKHSATTTAVFAWLRSPYASGSGNFCSVRTSGAAYYNDASRSRGVAPGFARDRAKPGIGKTIPGGSRGTKGERAKMSVPAYKRQKPDPERPRDPEFVLLSKKLYVEVIDLLSCMSARYGRLIAVPTAELAGEVQDFAVKANDVFPSDGQKLALRREYLLRCHAAAKALGERMDKVHEVLRSNPEGAFRNGKGVTLNAEAALKKLHRMETDVGADCVALRKKLEAVADSDKRRYMAQEKKRKS